MLLLNVSVKSRVRQILLITVLAIEVSAPIIVLGPSFAGNLDPVRVDTAVVRV
jgi:hypothetical protein